MLHMMRRAGLGHALHSVWGWFGSGPQTSPMCLIADLAWVPHSVCTLDQPNIPNVAHGAEASMGCMRRMGLEPVLHAA